MGNEVFRYDGKHVVVVGGATGMGAAAAQGALELGATVTSLDVAPIQTAGVSAVQVDLRDKASTSAAAEAVAGPIDAVLSCAGVADGTAGIERINLIAQLHLIEAWRDSGKLARGGAIAVVSSVAGLGWEARLPELKEFLDEAGWDARQKWIDAHPGSASYVFSKQALNAFVAREALPFLKRGVRINSIQPGPTDTPLARANADVWLAFGTDYRAAAGVVHLQAAEMANVLLFLCSPAASGVTGIPLLVDQGQINSAITGSFFDPRFTPQDN